MRRRKRAAVRLKTRALWNRLDLLSRSQNWLAQEMGVSRGCLSKLVNEERVPFGRIRWRMQGALGVRDFQELFALGHESYGE